MNDYIASKPGTGKLNLIDVVIPALNEQETIGEVVRTFRDGQNIGKIIVVSDLSKDRTAVLAKREGAIVVKGPGKGKGQAMMRGLREVTSHRVIFADADLHGLTVRHVNMLSMPAIGMVVGLRDKGKFNFATVASKVPPIAGERSVPTRFVRSISLEGYGAEMQINNAVVRSRMACWHFIMRGVTGEFKKGPLRMIDVAPYIDPVAAVNYHQLVKWLRPV